GCARPATAQLMMPGLARLGVGAPHAVVAVTLFAGTEPTHTCSTAAGPKPAAVAARDLDQPSIQTSRNSM
ncbi:MAG: hypothetical protein ACO3DJ_13915, partial [Alphaproteobacteria bacterium]